MYSSVGRSLVPAKLLLIHQPHYDGELVGFLHEEWNYDVELQLSLPSFPNHPAMPSLKE